VTSNLNDRFQRWLEQMGFRDNPFALYEADRERPLLPYFFVDRPYVAQVVGHPSRPQTTFLFARRGAGKTATREIVAYECASAELQYEALPVYLTDFGHLLEIAGGSVANITVNHYVRAILRAALNSLPTYMPALHFSHLDDFNRRILLGYADEFADPLTRLKLHEWIDRKSSVEPLTLPWQELSALELLTYFVQAVQKVGPSPTQTLKALYVLIDRVDETSGGREAVVPLLTPLIQNLAVLEAPGVAFKFFLDAQIGEEAVRAAAARPDRLRMLWIEWNQDSLAALINNRIAYYSARTYQHFGQLCSSSCRPLALNRLISATDGSPRELIRICDTLLQIHVERTLDRKTEFEIDQADVNRTIEEFQRIRTMESRLEMPASEIVVDTAPSIIPDSGLHIDSGGHVYIDGELLDQSLSDLEFRLLDTLFRASPQIVSNKELIRATWKLDEKDWNQEASLLEEDEQNLRKLITRLRRRLPDGDEDRFIRNARGRGYWLQLR
jgi:DNA-binding winged helix-turn-helix (wHTH) protein